MGIHKYGLDTSSSQLGIKSLGTRVPRADGHGSRSCIVVWIYFKLSVQIGHICRAHFYSCTC